MGFVQKKEYGDKKKSNLGKLYAVVNLRVNVFSFSLLFSALFCSTLLYSTLTSFPSFSPSHQDVDT